MSSTEPVNSFVLYELNQLETKNLRFSTTCELNSPLTISAMNYFGQVVEVDVQEPGSGPAIGTSTGFETPPPFGGSFAIATLTTPRTLSIKKPAIRAENFFTIFLLGQDK